MNYYGKKALSVNVGIRLRQMHEDQVIALRKLATLNGLSANVLSLIERNKTSPSVSTFYALSVPSHKFFYSLRHAFRDCF